MLGALCLIALGAGKAKVARIIRAAFGNRNEVVNVVLLEFLAAQVAAVALRLADGLDVSGGE